MSNKLYLRKFNIIFIFLILQIFSRYCSFLMKYYGNPDVDIFHLGVRFRELSINKKLPELLIFDNFIAFF